MSRAYGLQYLSVPDFGGKQDLQAPQIRLCIVCDRVNLPRCFVSMGSALNNQNKNKIIIRRWSNLRITSSDSGVILLPQWVASYHTGNSGKPVDYLLKLQDLSQIDLLQIVQWVFLRSLSANFFNILFQPLDYRQTLGKATADHFRLDL